MMMSERYCLVLTTCPDETCARQIGEHLVVEKLAACVNIIPGVTSIYSWEGQIESAQEQLLLVKTLYDQYPALERAICAIHPYELPEVIALPIDHGHPDYLNWISTWINTKPAAR